MERNRILVTGLRGERISRSDLIMYFQSKKKSGGGDVINIEYLNEREAILTFENEVVANNVLAREHVIRGYDIHTTVPRRVIKKETPRSPHYAHDDPTSVEDNSSDSNEDETAGDPEELCTIQVTNMSHRTTKDSFENYFENSNKSKGGPVRKVELKDTMAIVVFRYQADAKRVAEYKNHRLDQASLSVCLVHVNHKGKKKTLSKKGKRETHDPSAEEAMPLEFVISGISEITTEDALINYLENARRSGGGTVEELTFDEEEPGVAEVTFREVKSLDRLLGNQHRIDDSCLKIKVKEPEKPIPLDPFKIHVKGLSPATTNDCLVLYVEKMSQRREVQGVQRGSYNNALISFKEPIDFEAMVQGVQDDRKGLEGCKPVLESVPYCCCIQVSGLNENTSEDSLRLYFENERRGCGAEPREIYFQGEGRALVHFDDPSDIDKALNKTVHVLEKSELQMERFYPFLTEEKTTKKRNRKGKKTAVIEVDPDIMAHVMKRYPDELQYILDDAGIEMKWTAEEESSAAITEKEAAANRMEPWGKRVKVLQEYFEDFSCERTNVESRVWDEVLEAVTQQLISTDAFNDTDITTHNPSNEIIITGKKDGLQMAVSAVETLVRGIQEDKALQDSIETKVEKDFEKGKLALLKFCDLYEDLNASNKHVEIEVKEEDGELIIKGPRKYLSEISIELYKFISKVKEEVLELPERILGVLDTSKGRDFVYKSLLQNQIKAVLVHGQRKSKNEASIFAINKEQAKQAMKLIGSFTMERSIHLDEENIPVIKSSKWEEMVVDLEAQSVVSFCLEEQCQTLWISGVQPDVVECLSFVEGYIEKNTVLEDIVPVSVGCSRFLFQRFEKEIKDFLVELQDAFVKIQPNDCGEIKLTGTREGIDKSKEFVMSLARRIRDEEIKIDKPGMKKFFKTNKGAKLIKAIEAENKCTVELVDLDQLEEQGAGFAKEMAGSKRLSKGEIICSYTTMEGKKLVVYKDDLTKHPVDVIVNAANEDLQHVGGLARDIVRVGGKGIQDECDRFITRNRRLIEGHVMETGPGQLPCKRIIHAVGPRWESFNQATNKRILQLAFKNCLKTAEKYRSIAIPAVSAGIFGFPLDLCASILVETVTQFFQKNPSCNLSEVHFTNIDDITVKAFSDEMKRQFGKERSFSEGRRSSSPPLHSSHTPESTPSSMTFSSSSSDDKVLTTPEGISLVLKVGDISQETADVLVNTAGEDLNLQNNACARSFSQAAGPRLQQYCNKISPVEVGDIGITEPGQLQCQDVFHAVCGGWDGGKGEKILRDILQKCFNAADIKGARSIAIPAIGTGVLQFPRNAVARISFEEFFFFSKKQPRSLEEVKFILYDKDQLTVQAFRDEIANRSSSSKSSRKPKRRTSRKTNISTVRKRKDDWFEVDMDELSVQVQSGDITHETGDAIVVVSNSELDLEYGGGAGAAILKAGGPALERECRRHPTLQPGDVSMTSAGRGSLQVSQLIHYAPSSTSLNEAELTKAVLDCLHFAEQQGLSSISFPAIGTGNLGVKADQSAKAMLEAFSDFSKTNPTSVQLVRVVIYQKPMVKSFLSQMRDFVGEVPDKSDSPGWIRKLTNLIGITSEEEREVEIEHHESSEIFLHVYSDEQRHLKAAVRAITEMINENCQRQVIGPNDVIPHMEPDQRRKIRTLERQFDCKIQVEVAVGRIIVEGNNEDIMRAIPKIYEILHDVSDRLNRRKQAELLANDVEWLYEEQDGSFARYSKESNAMIEFAYINKEKEVTFEEDGEELVINFVLKEEYSKDGIARVRRKSRSEISLPDYWDPQPTISSGSEVKVHLVNLDPRKHVQEYLKVSDLVKKTLPATNKIKKIQRVQNPAQYKIYAVRRQRMDEEKTTGSNEKLLFHGTQPESCANINAMGFNRSYAGRNATRYGQGTYFAVDAEFSARSNYSPPDSKGNRYMYLARVLTGEYTVGDQSMGVPPPKNPANPTDIYDTTVDNANKPTIFVAFFDWQCYPEYLITFQ